MKARAAVIVTEATSDADAVAVARCLGDFLAWMRIRYAQQIWIIDKYFDPATPAPAATPPDRSTCR